MVRARLQSMRAILLAATLLLSMTAAAVPPLGQPLEPGVSLALAKSRAKQYRDLKYALRIQLFEGS